MPLSVMFLGQDPETPIRSNPNRANSWPHQTRLRWVEYFSDLLIIPVKTDESIPDNLPVKQDLDHTITEQKLEKAIKSTQLGKSPGPDGILL